jgi:uncharacterized damage-inducible protein DinB
VTKVEISSFDESVSFIPQINNMKQQLLTTLEAIENYTLGVAQLMTEDGYEFKPAEGARNFRELIHHIAYGIYWWTENFVQAGSSAWQPPTVTPTKRETVHYLMQAFASLQKTMNAVEPTEETMFGFYATVDHITHHRGQATVYLRCQGLTPPEYVF